MKQVATFILYEDGEAAGTVLAILKQDILESDAISLFCEKITQKAQKATDNSLHLRYWNDEHPETRIEIHLDWEEE